MALTNAGESSTIRRSTRPVAPSACEACRKLKMRCTRTNTLDNSSCDRCVRNHRPCRIPPARPLGRRPGAVGRFQGIEKAYRKIQAELKKGPASMPKAATSNNTQLSSPSVCEPDGGPILASLLNDSSQIPSEGVPDGPSQPISNPLALLADASEAVHANASQASKDNTHEGRGGDLLSRPGCFSLGLQLSRESLEIGLDALFATSFKPGRSSDYFKPPDPSAFRDVGPDLDPVDLGLVTMEEADFLFPIYFARLHPVNGILDPFLHTPEYVRSRSALLFTWILALTAQFASTQSSLAKRLQLHGEKLSRHVHTCGLKSVEIVQGYYISLLSATPAKTLAEERTWLYTMYAFGTAAELGLDQHSRSRGGVLVTSGGEQAPHNVEVHLEKQTLRFPSAVGNEDHTESTDCQRLTRNRERTWFRILLWERANSAARGRINPIPDTKLIAGIDTWWKHPAADAADKHTCAFILLRRHLASIHAELQAQAAASPDDPHWMKKLVDERLEGWCEEWLPVPYNVAEPSEQLASIFLYYVYLHNRLWILSFALQASENRNGNRHIEAIRQDCLQAAVHTCEVAVRDLQMVGEPLYCMLAPTWAMISYAAVLALKLFPQVHGDQPGGDIELLALLSQVSLQLERAGTTPPHRFGIAALLGEHLLGILRTKAASAKSAQHRAVEHSLPRYDLGHPASVLSESSGNLAIYNAQEPVSDPWFTDASAAMSYDLTGDSFGDLFREIFGPGFADSF
ncbi:Zn(II)2Cys6 transcription factor [Aspergillus aculeatinus CBS 121060]|uniref:Uncharacterized protein n=1 Tax=Aspergillus aculeatinus CBS 121060 TaxID=1448322 RepID=A0ACD1H231_9EURO|nr:hypothetical protein BO66DRAFT_473497 [Aspergillus aculeatinus CBS 121060]RAH67443.1 hypothetical protein BO66DRAFT_473497 [Aspergillus aculeatinus CBS 121060]